MVASRVKRFPVLVVTALQLSARRVSGKAWPTTAFLASQQAKSFLIKQRLFSNFSVLEMSAKPSYFLLKSEPDEFSIEDLRDCPNSEHEWDGVRNYQARNIMRTMKAGDRAFYYHSSCKVPAIVGKVVIIRKAEPDQTALDPKHQGYDPKSTEDNCRWDAVLVQFDTISPVSVTLKDLKALSKTDDVIGGMSLFKNSRLSVQEVTKEQWEAIEKLVKEMQAEKEES
jgi:predicted RNA-binding protein with PUA-like domain